MKARKVLPDWKLHRCSFVFLSVGCYILLQTEKRMEKEREMQLNLKAQSQSLLQKLFCQPHQSDRPISGPHLITFVRPLIVTVGGFFSAAVRLISFVTVQFSCTWTRPWVKKIWLEEDEIWSLIGDGMAPHKSLLCCLWDASCQFDLV